MTDPVIISDHGDRAVANMTHDFKASTMVNVLIKEVLVKQIQRLEETVFALIVDRTIGGAIGEQLDAYGRLIGEPRGALSDQDYRLFLAARIKTNRSSGTIETIIDVVSTVTNATRIAYMAHHPAAFTVQYESDVLTAAYRTRVKNQIASMVPAGVRFDVVDARPDAFGFEDDLRAKGFNNGEWATLI